MTLTTWLALFSVSLLGAMSPGPSLAIVAKHTLAGGRVNGIAAAWAHALGIGVYALLTLLGLAVVLQQMPMVFHAVSYAGAGYLAYLGWQALRSQGGIADKLSSGNAVPWYQSAREGALISLLNPKIALFFIALFSQFVHLDYDHWDKLTVIATPTLIDGLWYTLMALLLSQSHVVSMIRRHAVWIDRVTGVVFLALAAQVFIHG
ncbi:MULTISPECIES: LysE family translocator [unclassified Vibrio]|uniref:LysE family translocator n=1 Tax=Vibrio sp. HB236076 TaxID=3232307 RepID=A0AB39HEY9_9VIBR|nr:LysE family translocator [Vibrio sp. HB161653]MDP5254109.1 LysE family translocator [Vibrio sp. HB161653]